MLMPKNRMWPTINANTAPFTPRFKPRTNSSTPANVAIDCVQSRMVSVLKRLNPASCKLQGVRAGAQRRQRHGQRERACVCVLKKSQLAVDERRGKDHCGAAADDAADQRCGNARRHADPFGDGVKLASSVYAEWRNDAEQIAERYADGIGAAPLRQQTVRQHALDEHAGDVHQGFGSEYPRRLVASGAERCACAVAVIGAVAWWRLACRSVHLPSIPVRANARHRARPTPSGGPGLRLAPGRLVGLAAASSRTVAWRRCALARSRRLLRQGGALLRTPAHPTPNPAPRTSTAGWPPRRCGRAKRVCSQLLANRW